MAEGHTGFGGGPSKAPENRRCPVRRLAPSRTAAFLAAEIRSRPQACAGLEPFRGHPGSGPSILTVFTRTPQPRTQQDGSGSGSR